MLGKFVQLRLQGVRDPFISMANGKAKAPPPPDYTGAAEATASGNLEAARATAAANRTNQVTPYGSLTYTANPGTDPYGNTLYTATQTLSPEQQAIYEQESKLNQGLMSTANTGLQYANQVLSQPGVNMSNLPSLTNNVPTGQLATSYNVQNATGNLDLSGMPALKSSIETQGLPSYGINPGETYSDAIMRRLQPDLERQRSAEEARLANQGIGLGSNAYSTAKDILGRQQNDALTSAIVQGMGVGLQANQQQFGQNEEIINKPLLVVNLAIKLLHKTQAMLLTWLRLVIKVLINNSNKVWLTLNSVTKLNNKASNKRLTIKCNQLTSLMRCVQVLKCKTQAMRLHLNKLMLLVLIY
jgi:hypothetical protein